MKIEIFQVDHLAETTSCMTCFEVPSFAKKKLANKSAVDGICIIDDIPIKFHFSPNGLDGDIFTDDFHHRTIIKHLIPLWYIEKFNL